MIKKCLTLLMALLFIALPVCCAEQEMAYRFELSVDGQETVEVSPGEIITVMLRLRRENSDAPYSMHGMQTELRYDSTFLELVQGSGMASAGVATKDIAVEEPYREYYMNFLSMSGGTQWNADTLVGTAQFRVIGDAGVTRITNQDFLVSLPDGSGSYPCAANELYIVLSPDCTVTFRTNGGSEVESQKVLFGEKALRPEDPTREGYRLDGWYTDIHLTDEWDFESDAVRSDMLLYAKWTQAPAEAPEFDARLIALLAAGGAVCIALIALLCRRRKK